MIRKFQNHTPQIPDSCYIFPTATIIGNVIMGENVIAYPGVVIRAEHHQVTIGDNTNLQENSTISTHSIRFQKVPMDVRNDLIKHGRLA